MKYWLRTYVNLGFSVEVVLCMIVIAASGTRNGAIGWALLITAFVVASSKTLLRHRWDNLPWKENELQKKARCFYQSLRKRWLYGLLALILVALAFGLFTPIDEIYPFASMWVTYLALDWVTVRTKLWQEEVARRLHAQYIEHGRTQT